LPENPESRKTVVQKRLWIRNLASWQQVILGITLGNTAKSMKFAFFAFWLCF
jgi:hypothetical protein